jgi:hypothetical protein
VFIFIFYTQHCENVQFLAAAAKTVHTINKSYFSLSPWLGKVLILPASSTACHIDANSNLIFLPENSTRKMFLADTGVSLSILPHKSSAHPFSPKLLSVNGANVNAWSFRPVTLSFGQHKFTFRFLLADVKNLILGIDFFKCFNLLVLPPTHQVLFRGSNTDILHMDSVLQVAPSASPQPLPTAASVSQDLGNIPPQVQELLRKFPGLLRSLSAPPKPLHGASMLSRPRATLFLRTLAPQRTQASGGLGSGLGIIRRSNSPWSSPLHMVQKKDGGWRPCGDYRRLNNITTPDRYPLPNIQDLNNRLAGCTVFSTLDLVKGYHQVPVAAADVPNTAIVTPFGLFEYVYMPFGLKNAAQTFQGLVDRIFAGLPYVFIYLDDNLVATAGTSNHLQALQEIFGILEANGLVLNL